MTTRHSSFNDLLARADDETLQEIVGSSAVSLLSALDHQLATPSRLRRTCLQLHPPEALLRDRSVRKKLLLQLRPPQATALASHLGLAFDNPYAALLSARIRKNSLIERRLFDYLGVVPVGAEPARQAPAVEHACSEYSLFDHQRQAAGEVLDALQYPNPRVLLHMPTGAGKTRTALHIVCDRLRQGEPSIVLWLAYSEELCDQAAAEFETAWSHLGNRTTNLYRYWSPSRSINIEEVRDGFIVAGLAKIYERAKRDVDFMSRLADRTSMVVIDEAHQATAETYRFLLEYLVERKPSTGLLGLTATPGRTWSDPAIDQQLADLFGRRKVTLRVSGYQSPVDYLISEGYLARPTYRSLPSHSGGPLTNRQVRDLAMALDVPEALLRQLAEDVQRNLVVVSAAEDLARRHKRILVFAATVEHATLLATVLQARGLDAASVTATTPLDERNRIITRYQNNQEETRILCNFGVLAAGFDAPSTSAVIIARPTKSLVLYSQMIGRALRGRRAGGNEHAEVLTVVDTHLPGFGSMSEAFMNWEDIWNE